ncbi:hypothetical protein GCM10023185_00770 [Hymenobacter saemangeumensis]|uniref:Uncharacterized protein n=1 Tax=Hymenobacter saemangeumensis TaxID=1084522 RepID=A0ABP8HWX4_9BACT
MKKQTPAQSARRGVRSAFYPTLGLAASLLLASSCSHEEAEAPALAALTTEADAVSADLVAAPAIAASNWTAGRFTGSIVPLGSQRAMPNVTLGGNPIVKSNNPEKFTSTGWLTQHTYTHPSRGGNNAWLSGNFNIYVSHYNGLTTQAYLQVLAVNPHAYPITVSYRGSILTSSEAGDSRGILGKSNYYMVTENMLRLPSTVTSKTIPARGAVLLALKRLNSGGSVDGTLLVNAASPGVFTYVVATNTDRIDEGLSLAHNPSTRRPATGNIKPPTVKDFGTEAGVYGFSKVTATPNVPLPGGIGHIGISVNYAGYEETVASPYVQTAPANRNGSGQILRLFDSSYRTNGNYGHEYNVTLRLQNTLARPRRVKVWFASNAHTATRGLLYNGAMLFNGSTRQVVTKPIKTVPNEPFNARQELTVVNGVSQPLLIGANSTLNVPVQFYIPGLSSAGAHFILETQD